MTDATISPTVVRGGGKPAANQKQIIMLAVLGVAFLAVFVLMVLPMLTGGGGSTPAPAPAPAPAAPAAGAPAAGAPAAPAQATPSPEVTSPAPPPARPARSPFDPPR